MGLQPILSYKMIKLLNRSLKDYILSNDRHLNFLLLLLSEECKKMSNIIPCLDNIYNILFFEIRYYMQNISFIILKN